MICLNSAGNLVRSEVGNKSWPSSQACETKAREIFLLIRAMSFARTRTNQGSRKASRNQNGLHLELRSWFSFESSKRQGKRTRAVPLLLAMGSTSPTLRRAWPQDGPAAAICVQSVDVQCVLQFTLIHAAGCVLHRRTSRVIHRLKLFFVWFNPFFPL